MTTTTYRKRASQARGQHSKVAPSKRQQIARTGEPIKEWFRKNGHPNYDPIEPNSYWKNIKEIKDRKSIDSRQYKSNSTSWSSQFKQIPESAIRSRRQIFTAAFFERGLFILNELIIAEVSARLFAAGVNTTRAAELSCWLEAKLEKDLAIGLAAVAAGEPLPPIDPNSPIQRSRTTIDHDAEQPSANLPPVLRLAEDQAKTMLEPVNSNSNAKRPRPQLPNNLEWPVGDYGDSPEAKGQGNIVSYLERVWLPILEAGRRDGRIYVDRRIMSDHYSGVLTAMKNYQRTDPHTGERKTIPPHLRFPTLKAVNNLIVAANPDAARIAANRAKNGIPIFNA